MTNVFSSVLVFMESRSDFITRLGLPTAWIGSTWGLIANVEQTDITLYLSWASMGAATFASLVVASAKILSLIKKK